MSGAQPAGLTWVVCQARAHCHVPDEHPVLPVQGPIRVQLLTSHRALARPDQCDAINGTHMPGGVRLKLAGISSTAWPGVLVGLKGSQRARASAGGVAVAGVCPDGSDGWTPDGCQLN